LIDEPINCVKTVGRRRRPTVPAQGRTGPLLRVADVAKSFAGVRALQGVSFDVEDHAIVGLIGPNGAGKTTLFNCITGFLEPDTGEVWFGGGRVDGAAPHRIARMGLVRTFQSIRMFSGMTVFESILVAQHAARTNGGGVLRRGASKVLPSASQAGRAAEVVDLLGLSAVQNRRCVDLPLLTQRKIEVARAVACRPRMVLLDEPSAGATAAETRELIDVIHALRERGMTVLVIEHNVPFVMGVADSIVVLNFGEVAAVGTPEAIASNEIVREIYLGTRESLA
jgi:branched-chain amino acid transport system ATP-binding protein